METEQKSTDNKPKKAYKPKKEVVKKVEVKKATPKLVKKKYPLIKDVTIGGKLKKKGTLVELTEQGRIYFKQQFYIK